jgi:hypothetical protein
MNSTLKRWAIFLLACVVAVPVLIYVMGNALVGPYEGESGLLGLMARIYGDAIGGNLSAWLVLLGPALLALMWLAPSWLQRRIK